MRYLAPMLLKMAVEDTEIDRVALEPRWLKQRGYIEALLACLRVKHKEAILLAAQPPQFYLETGSRMNEASFAEDA